jgi:hypothetical protein
LATSVSTDTAVLVLALEHSRTVKSASFRAAILWGLLGALCVFLTFFFVGIVMADFGRVRVSGSVLCVITCFVKCAQNIARHERASRDVQTYEAAFQEEFAADPAFGGRAQPVGRQY